ncbi:uncharacterized protein METZ01_LOCUS208967, partial [marine metagenome]
MDKELEKDEIKILKSQIAKLTLEGKLRKDIGNELERQKKLALEAKNELHLLTEKLSKYLSPQLYDILFSGYESTSASSSRKKLTIFFSDLVQFTRLSDKLEPEELTEMLNFYLTEMSNIALESGGTIDKYIGDAILIFFGDPESSGHQEDAAKCVSMAIDMQKRMKELRNNWIKDFGLEKPLSARIGISTGYCSVGNFGSASRLDYTVIGSAVNLAARLQTSCKEDGILLSKDTYWQVKEKFQCNNAGKIEVKGFAEAISTYEVLF